VTVAPAVRTGNVHRVRSFSVRAHVIAFVGLLAFTLLGVGAYQTIHQFSAARREAGLDTAFQADLAASALERSVDEARAFTADTAANPSVAQLFEQIDGNYELCSLTAGGTGLFPEGSIHFVDQSGFLFCSSATERIDRDGIRFEQLDWFQATLGDRSDPPVQAAPFVDPATMERSIALAAPVKSADGSVIGAVVYALPVVDLAAQMVATYGGRGPLTFEVTSVETGQVVSSSETAIRSGTSEMDLRSPPEAALVGSDGVRRFYRSAAAEGTGFTVTAGVSEAVTLAAARTSLWQHLTLTLLALVVTLGVGLLINRRIGRPLRRLTQALDQAGRAITPEPVDVDGPREVRALVLEFNHMLATRASIEGQLQQRAMFDELTGLPNRAVAIDRLSHALERTRRGEDFVSVLSIDLDRFGVVNESFGRDVGDRMLIRIANRIRSVLRPEDTIARFYGDEFVVICENTASREHASAVAGRIAESLREPLREGEGEATISVSIGIALGRYFRDSAETLLRDADTARTKAKERGKARSEFFEDAMREGARNRLDIENELRRAVDLDELQPFYQPIVDLASGKIIGAEALIRWHHPTKGTLLPGVFIDLAEETGLIVPIGRRVLEQACAQAAMWSADGHRIRVSVNVSPRQLVEEDLEQDVRVVLGTSGLDPSLLCIEITENTLMREDAGPVLDRLRALGAAISVDDFGTGYSSLAYLQRFPVDELKIDRAFVRDLGTKDNASALVSAMVGVAKALELNVVAEGIEEEAQLREVRALGCDAAQGFFLMRPQPADAVSALLTLDAVKMPDRLVAN
jgi:diguanylate cyclase (GGDEF)-like protein